MAERYGKGLFASDSCHEYNTYKKLSDTLDASKKLDLGKLYKSLKDRIKSAESSYREYASAYKSSKRREDNTKLDRKMENNTINELVSLSSFANNLKAKLKNLVKDISEFDEKNVKCNGNWVSKKTEKEDKKAAAKQKKEEKKQKKAKKEEVQ